MTNDNCWRELNIFTDGAIRPDFVFPDGAPGWGIHWRFTHDQFLTDEWYNDFKSKLGFEGDATIILFYSEPYTTNPAIHIDINEKENPLSLVPGAFNWRIGGDNTSMVWFNKEGFDLSDVETEVADASWAVNEPNRKAPVVALWNASDYQEVSRNTISTDYVTLVNTGIAHRIERGPTERWCVSIRLPIKAGDNWDSYVNMSSPYFRL